MYAEISASKQINRNITFSFYIKKINKKSAW